MGGVRIHHGYRMKDRSLGELQAFAVALRSAVQREANEGYIKLLAEISVQFFDEYLADLDLWKKRYADTGEWEQWSPLSMARSQIRKAQNEIEIKNRRNPRYDFGCILDFLPGSGYIYLLLHSEQEAYGDLLEGFEGVEPYPYWTDSDELPEGITQEQWEARGAEWKAVMNGSWLPAKAGYFRFDCEIEFGYVEPQFVASRQPEYAKRVKRMARDLLLTRRVKSLVEADPETDIDDQGQVRMNSAVRHVVDAQDWLQGDEGVAAVLTESERLKLILPQQVSAAQLEAKFGDIKNLPLHG